jgi:hypothetical protein
MPVERTRFFAFTDPSGGSADSFALAVGHKEKDGTAVIDAIREIRPPFSPEAAVEELSALMASYRVTRVTGDRWGGEWPREQFRKHGITYEVAKEPKSTIYQNVLPLLNSGRLRLLDHQRLIGQLCSLERRTSRGGKDSIDHPPNAHDDIANAVCGVAATCKRGAYVSDMSWVRDDDDSDDDAARRFQQNRLSNHVLTHSGYYGRYLWR